MRRCDVNGILLSPTDLVQFLDCEHATWMSWRQLSEPQLQEALPDEILIQRGRQHEQNYLNRWRQSGQSVTSITSPHAWQQTLDAMQRGDQVIYQAELRHGRWLGRPDFLVRVDGSSRWGDWHYEPYDTKFARSVKPEHLVQLCVYAKLLTDVQGTTPANVHVVLDRLVVQSFPTKDFIAYVRFAQRRLEKFVATPPTASEPEPCAACPQCAWRDHCENWWNEVDHLSLVANIRQSQREKLKAHGIRTVQQLAETKKDPRELGFEPSVFQKLQQQARLQNDQRQSGLRKHVLIDPGVPHRGLSRLPQPQPGDLFFDMEGDPYQTDGGLEYLFGIGFYQTPDRFVYHAFWAHNKDEERQAFQAFMQFLEKHFAEYPTAHIYHYNSYETNALKKLASRYRLAESQLDNLLRQQRFVDLYRIVQQSIQVSEPSYSLKYLEPYFHFQRQGSVRTAEESTIKYHRYQEDPNQYAHVLQEIEEYNRMDCQATAALRDWLIRLRGNDRPWFRVPSRDDEKKVTQVEREQQIQDLVARLETTAGRDSNHPCRILSDLLEFHRREAKPSWWSYYDRRERPDSDWLDDLDCLAGLERQESPVRDKRSWIYVYRFPPQETRLREGDSVEAILADGESTNGSITIVRLDEAQGLVWLKTTNAALPERLSIHGGIPIDAKKLQRAVERVAWDGLNGFVKYPLARQILERASPQLNGRSAGESLVRKERSLEEEVAEAAAALDHSYFFIQGPPGTGKTYLTARVILHLIEKGQKVGVSSNSHKAINNLLSHIEKAAHEKKIGFHGLKKYSDESDMFANGEFITNVKQINIRDIEMSQLMAGTAWAFADDKLEQMIDTLFIDEAGQMSLANVVVMTTAARNMVLVGDQMQLGQPIQGVHPGRSGESILTYLFGDRATVTADRGIFLDRTWRLRPEVCQFVSEAFYEGRLHPHDITSTRVLEFDERLAGKLPTAGVYFHPVTHFGCSQRSEEEGRVIKDYVEKLVGQKYHPDEKIVRELRPEDLMVVTPYNAQVNYLSQVLPKGVSVGTVDKFQGQEAAVVLISMVASSRDDIPRGLEFLLSAQRLNVAVSRARCLAIAVASPKLLAVPCVTIEQMRLANKFCMLAEAGGYTGD